MELAWRQTSLFGGGAPAIEPNFERLRRTQLDPHAWVEHAPSWVSGHEALMDLLVSTTEWQSLSREMYDRTVDVPRLVASVPDHGPGHPVLEQARVALSRHYKTEFSHLSLALYRDGNDSVAWHGDYVAREMNEDTLVASISLGEPRRLLLRPRQTASTPGGGRQSVSFSLGWGDLFVMGGACQRTWEHAVPKVARAQPRMAVMFRPTWYRPDAVSSRT
jgi:alkylated DNA repair dioxygenase AlkB